VVRTGIGRSGKEHAMSVHHQIRRLRRLAIRAALVTFVGCALVSPAAAEGDAPTIFRVRSSDSSISALIDLAAARSLTFRRLLTLIQASDGIVYVEPGECGHGTRACLKVWMRSSGSNRFLRVVVNRRKADSDLDFMGSIGHELQHTVEALSEPGTVDGIGLYNFFSRVAPTSSNRFETTAAINAGDAVRDELRDRRWASRQ
jgi:hypothetical protein